jgi:hypothetical protein
MAAWFQSIPDDSRSIKPKGFPYSSTQDEKGMIEKDCSAGEGLGYL